MSQSNGVGMTLSPARPDVSQRLRAWWRTYRVGLLFFAPFGILFILFVLLPVFSALGLSFSYYNMLQSPTWVGIKNYRNLLMDDQIFQLAIRNTLVFALITGPIGLIFSFVMAWVIDQLKFKRLFAFLFFAPSITSGIAMGVVWGYFFSPDRYGLLNTVLIDWGIISEPVLWNLSADTILPVIMFVQVWMSMGTGFLVFLAGLTNIPDHLYEAARIDGVRNRFQELWYITLPSMKPQLLFGAVNSIVASFAVFDITIAVCQVMPTPNYAGHTIVAHLYDYAFIRFEMGYASTIAVILFLMTFLLGRLAMRIFSSKDM